MADLTAAPAADLLIVGGGIAGMCAALEAPAGARIVVLDKGEAGSSPLAQGGMAAAVGPDDSPEQHALDTILAGAGLCDEEVVHDVCAEGPDAVAWLVAQGAAFDRNPDGTLHVAREGAQTFPRSVHRVDATGAEIVRALRLALRERNVERVRARAERLVVADGACIGVVAGGTFFPARATLLATGGAGGLWGRTTNQPGALADGAALAMLAGVRLADLELMQFHPTALAVGGLSQRVLLTEALRGDGARLVDARGERFIDELAPRHVVAGAILAQGGAWLDCRDVERLDERFPTVLAAVRAQGLDPAREPIPVEPAAHYFIGGVAADAHGNTSLPGLLAAGEAAATGFDGANRMAGNSLLQAVVVGRRIGRSVGSGHAAAALPAAAASDGAGIGAIPAELPEIVWRAAGPIRDEAGLAEGLRAVDALAEAEGPLPHLALVAMILRAARARTETRGVHARADFPASDPALIRRTFDSGQAASSRP